jgi:hypothetical protein
MGAPVGEGNGNVKLTADDVRLIRELLAERDRLRKELKELSLPKVAAKFEIHPLAVYRIYHRDTWRHV